MSDAALSLLAQAAFAFVGTVERLGDSTMADVPADDATAIVHVDETVHVPDAFAQLAGMSVTLQPAAGAEPLAKDDRFVFFANGVAFGEGIVLTEVGRQEVAPLAAHLMGAGPGGAEPPERSLGALLAAARVQAHAATADAIVLGRVVGLARAAGSPVREHARDLWTATLHVTHVERGDVQPDSEIDALYANSLDARWHDAPKPKASQNGLWLLHATTGAEAALAPFEMFHPEDLQPVQNLELLRTSANGSGGS
jgi:hypothetical protein